MWSFIFLLEIDISLTQVLVVFVVSAFGMALPSTPGSFGVYEASMIMALSWYGIDKEQAVVAALLCHLIQFVPAVVTSLIILFKMPINLMAAKSILKQKLPQ